MKYYPIPINATEPVYEVSHTRRVFLLNAGNAPQDTPLQDLLVPRSGFNQTATWYSEAKLLPALEVSPHLDRVYVYVNNMDYGTNSAAYVDLEFVVAQDVAFKWTRHTAIFANNQTQDYFTPPDSINFQYTVMAGTTFLTGTTHSETAYFYKLEKRKVRVWAHKAKVTNIFSIDTRLTFGQPDATGGLPVADPNEPSQYVDFSSSIFNGGLFLGQANYTGSARDRSGKSIIQASLPVSSNTPGATIGRALTLYTGKRLLAGAYPATPHVNVRAAHPVGDPSQLTDLINDPKRWSSRWPVDEENETNGDPYGVSSILVAGPEMLYTWPVSNAQAVTGSAQLVALYPENLHPKTTVPGISPWWYYFHSSKFFTSPEVPTELKNDHFHPRVWTISVDPITTESPVLSQYFW